MAKTSLPVLIIKNMVLFPWNEVRLEFDQDQDKKIISIAEAYYGNNLLIITPKDDLEIDPDMNEFPKIGVLASIKMKIDMPNNKTRIILSGLSRVEVHVYHKEENLYEAMVSQVDLEELSYQEELAYTRALSKHIEVYVKEVPYISNSILSQIAGVTSVGRLSDMIAPILPITIDRQKEYIHELSSTSRVKMILDDINRDMEILRLEHQIEEDVAHGLDQSQKEFILREKIKVIQSELGEGEIREEEANSLRSKIEKLKCSKQIKEKLRYELRRYENSNQNSPEIGSIRTYLDIMLSLPWKIYSKEEGNLEKVQKRLDESHYGLEKVKERIIEYLAAKQNSAILRSPVLCFVGPPGVGKTTLAKSIALAMHRKWTKISVGGVKDEADIIGHRRAYVGSGPGLIIQGMKKAGTSNPVFIIDEIDKMTKDMKGDPASSLLEVLDHEQNQSFIDHYIEEEYDLSQVLFITTANYVEQIPPELLDRLEIIHLYSYTEYEKLDIVKKYLIPKELEEHNLRKSQIVFYEDAILDMIRNYTKEAGVRELDRLLIRIIRKVIKESKMNNQKMSCIINKENLIHFLGNPKFLDVINKENKPGVVNGLAYTPYGGDVLPIEVIYYPGKGNLILTGSLGNVMRESAMIAISYIKTNASALGLTHIHFDEYDIHIHLPEGAIPKDGPSAGVALTTALLSAFLHKKVTHKIALTGEITLTGDILAVGGIREKVLGAKRAGVGKVFLPRRNDKDLEEIPQEVLEGIEFVFVLDYMDIFKKIWRIKAPVQ